MSLPWYVTGAARPDYAKYKGWKQDAKQIEDTVARIRAQAAGDSVIDSTRPAAPSTPPYINRSVQPAPMPTINFGGGGGGPGLAMSDVYAVDPVPDSGAAVGPASPYGASTGSLTFNAPKKEEEEEKKPEPIVLDLPPTALDLALQETWGNLENEGASAYMKTRGRNPATVSQEQREAQVQAVADRYNAQARWGELQRKRAEREKRDRKEKYEEITINDWNAYSPLQQAGVQSNADLQSAATRDRRMAGKHHATAEEIQLYEKGIREMFGEGSTLGVEGLHYAPETLGFLQDRGLSRADMVPLGLTIDDFVMMDTALNKKQIGNLHQDVPEPELDYRMMVTPTGAPIQIGVPVEGGEGLSMREARLRLAQKIAKGQLQYQERNAELLKRGEGIISGMTQAATNATTASELGGTPRRYKKMEMTPEDAQFVERYMEALARTDFTEEEAIAAVQANLVERGISEQEQARTWDLIVHSAEKSALGEYGWFEDYQGTGTIGRSPTEVAAMAGAPTLKRRRTRGDSAPAG